MIPDSKDVNKLGNELEQLIMNWMVERKGDTTLAVAVIAALSHVMVCTACHVFGNEMGMECIMKAINASARKWQLEEDKEDGETKPETKNRGETGRR